MTFHMKFLDFSIFIAFDCTNLTEFQTECQLNNNHKLNLTISITLQCFHGRIHNLSFSLNSPIHFDYCSRFFFAQFCHHKIKSTFLSNQQIICAYCAFQVQFIAVFQVQLYVHLQKNILYPIRNRNRNRKCN